MVLGCVFGRPASGVNDPAHHADADFSVDVAGARCVSLRIWQNEPEYLNDSNLRRGEAHLREGSVGISRTAEPRPAGERPAVEPR